MTPKEILRICRSLKIEDAEVLPDGTVALSNGGYFGGMGYRRLPFQISSVTHLSLAGCLQLLTLKGCPRTVNGNFSVTNCPELESLEFSPEIVNGSFSCDLTVKFSDLVGMPQQIGGSANIGPSCVRSLRGISKEIGGELGVGGSLITPSESKYALLSKLESTYGVPIGWSYDKAKKFHKIMTDGRNDGYLPSETIPERIRDLKILDGVK